MKQINLKLTVNQIEDLDKLSKAMGNVSKSNLIRVTIAEYISKHRSIIQQIGPKPKKVTRFIKQPRNY